MSSEPNWKQLLTSYIWWKQELDRLRKVVRERTDNVSVEESATVWSIYLRPIQDAASAMAKIEQTFYQNR